MHSLQHTTHVTLRTLLAGQPTSAAKIAFAWQVVAGEPLARHGEARWTGDGTLRVRAENPAWGRELRFSRDVLVERMNELLGRGVITRMVVDTPEPTASERRRQRSAE